MANRWCYLLFVFFVSMTLIVSGCSSTPKPRKFSGQLTAAADINPDHEERSSPLIVKIYHLKETEAFQKIDFFSLYDNEKSVLGKDLVFSEERELQPDSSHLYKIEINPEAKYIGVLAAFIKIEDSQWRAVVKLPEKKFFNFKGKRKLRIYVKNRTVSASFIKP